MSTLNLIDNEILRSTIMLYNSFYHINKHEVHIKSALLGKCIKKYRRPVIGPHLYFYSVSRDWTINIQHKNTQVCNVY